MDGQRFDDLARKLAGVSSRRGLLRALAGGSAGVLASRLFGPDADDDVAAQTTCTRSGQACTADGECCATMVCRRGMCRQGCRIDGAFRPTGGRNPDNACLACRPGKSTTDWSPVNDGTTCDDGDLCTTGDVCQAGVCTGGKKKCGKCRTCDPATGACSAVANGTPCDDGNLCTVLDYCQDGVCHPGEKLGCVHHPCQHSKCNPATGQCELSPVADGTACRTTPEDACHTSRGICQAGACVATAKVCAACHTCDPARGCVRLANGTACDTGDPCQNGTCHAGVCQATPKTCGRCHACEPGVGCVQVAAGTPCDDFNICTEQSHCDENGLCVGTPKTCPQCQKCVQEAGGCVAFGNDPCEMPCYQGTCAGGECSIIIEEKDCSALDSADGCQKGQCDPETGQCLAVAVADGTRCGDFSNPCAMDSCQDGLCKPSCCLLGQGETCVNDSVCCRGLYCVETMHLDAFLNIVLEDKCSSCESREGEPCFPEHGDAGCCPSQECVCDSTQVICQSGGGWACKTH